MRRFHSYGPVDSEQHFCVERRELVEECVRMLAGDLDKGGHYFTIWAPRQTGKTWLMRRAMAEIKDRLGDRFAVYGFSLGNLRGMRSSPPDPWDETRLPPALSDVLELTLPGRPQVKTWKEFSLLFSKDGLWSLPLILLIDEADTAPAWLLDLLAGRFREMYLSREHNFLHGLALIGVRAVLGVESDRGSPFNIQRSLHISNFTPQETAELFRQYQEESGQTVAPEVVEHVFESTRGQPGLVGWFGELLTEKFQPGKNKTIDLQLWKDIFRRACTTEWNNTILNLIKKTRERFCPQILELFTRADVPFSIDADWCGYAYQNGIIGHENAVNANGEKIEVCRFASPFIQLRIYNALTLDMVEDRMPILALDPLDDLRDVFEGPELALPALLRRYKDYLKRLKVKGINPWKEQPRRADLHLTEAVGHFHLYAWLKDALEDHCIVSPEFPTGNGKVDIYLKCGDKEGIIEVKSFKSLTQLESAKTQAARYAAQVGSPAVALVVFVPVADESVLEKLSEERMIEGVRVTAAAIGWV
jgi:hypothetical protein